MANNKREQAKTLAAAGASAQKIQRQTGVSSTAATKFASQAAAPANSMKIDYQDVINNPGKYDAGYSREVASQNPDSVIYKGLYGGGLQAGDGGGFFGLKGYQVPGATNGIGPDGSVLFVASPNGNSQEWLNENFGPGGRYYGGARGGSTAAATPGSPSAATDAAASTPSAKAGGYQAAMANGRISRNEINAKIDQRAQGKGKDFNRNNAYLRITNRWAGKGGGLGQGVLTDFNQAYEQKNPFASMLYGKTGNLNQILAGGRSKKQQSMNDLYTSGRGYLENKNYAKGDVFSRLKDGTLRAGKPVGNGYNKPATTTETTPTTQTGVNTNTIPGPVGAATDGPMDQLQKDYAAMGPGGLYGGGPGGPGASRVRRARSRQQRLSIRGAGTSINNRTSPFFNSLN